MATDIETVADIIAEMRSDANADDYTPDGILGQKLNYIADRLEAARKRMEWTHKKELDTRDAVIQTEVAGREAEREALKKCLLYIACAESVGVGTITLNDKVKLDPKKIIKLAKEALAATTGPHG